ncbi:hypothetical protein [Actinotalea caeni]|uniref:hypothetical protein n=1 Tax=Actinotalea caeni TaxID=1348467 RepID=UPI0012E2893E|nr:hypothetical protein [Actinotalea caeni]
MATRWARASAALPAAVVATLAALLALLATVWSPAPADAEPGDRTVVLVGVPGLRWDDAEHLGGFLDSVDDLAAGSLVVRSTTAVACPADGWLAISAGNRAAGGCDNPREPVDGAIPGWDGYLAAADDASFGAEPGLLGDVLAEAGVTTTAIGPGAAVALATSDGTVADYRSYLTSTLTQDVADAVERSDLVVVDLGDVWHGTATGDRTREEAVATVAAQLDAVLAGAAAGTDPVVLVSGISDDGAPAGLRLLASAGLGAGELSSPSTRQAGYVLATDQHAWLLDLLGVDPGPTSSIGAPAQVATTTAPADVVAAAQDRERHSDAQRPLIPGFFLGLVLVNLTLFAAVAVGLRRPKVARRVTPHRGPVLRTLRALSLGVAAIPVASYLTNLLPWWRVEPPVVALLAGVVAIAGLIVAVALLGPWRRALLGPAAAVAAVTAVVLAVDVVTGARLQVSAIMGIPTLVAGRFYGMNNTSFALFTASSILLTTALANTLVQRGRRRAAATVVVGVGVVAIVVDGAPSLGADFGGPPALLVAFGLLTLFAAGIRVTARRVVLVLLGAALVTTAIAFVDWLRPPGSRTHLGRFFADVLDGQMWPVIGRKLDQNLTILFNNRPLTILAICGVLLVVLVLIRPVKETITSPHGGEFAWLSGGAPISAMARTLPMLRPGLIALAVAAGIGFAVNDSGIAIPALAVAVAVPLLLASCATWMLGRVEPGPAPADGAQAPR